MLLFLYVLFLRFDEYCIKKETFLTAEVRKVSYMT